jgi:hypothetical protein
MRPRFALLIAALLGLLLAAACSGSDDTSAPSSGLLRLVPNTEDFRAGVTIVDYDAIRALPHYKGEVDPAEVEHAMILALAGADVGGMPFELLGYQDQSFATGISNLDEGFGIPFEDIDRSLTAGTAPPIYLHAIGGDFDPAAIEDHLAACGDCISGERLDYRGLDYWSWEGDMTLGLRLRPPAFDQFGRGGYLRFTDDAIVRSNFQDDFEASLDASLGDGSLLDDDAFRLVAEAADDLDLLALYVTDRTQGPAEAARVHELLKDNDDLGAAIIAAWDTSEDVRLLPYEVALLGVGVEDGEPVTTILLAHASEAAATENATRLEQRLQTTPSILQQQPWTEVFDSWEITSDGPLLIATLRGDAELRILEFFDPLLLHE